MQAASTGEFPQRGGRRSLREKLHGRTWRELGGVLFDFGPYPSSQMKTLQGRQKAVEELGAFAEGLVRELGSADAAPVLAFEVRNPTLLTPRLMALLEKLRHQARDGTQ